MRLTVEQSTESQVSARPRATLEARVLRSVEEIEAIRPIWSAWRGHRDSDLDFFLAVLKSNKTSVRPHVILVTDGDAPQALFVGRLDRDVITFRVGYLKMRCRADVLYFVYGAFRGKQSPEVAKILINEIRRNLADGEADVAYLNFLRSDSDLHRTAFLSPGLMERDHVPTRKPHFGMIMPASIEDLYNGLTPKVRKNLKRQWRKLLEDYNGAVLVREFRNADEVDELAATVESIARTNYQRGLGVGFRDCPEERQRLRLSATKGWLRANVLYLNEKPCAFWIGALNNGVFLSDYLGFDPAYAKHSPGMSLIMNVLESFLNGSDTVTEIDFATGDAQYKEVLSNYQFDETAAYLFSRSAAGAKLNTLRTVTAKTDQTAKTILSTIGLQEKIKKFWRHRAQLKNAS